MPPGGVDECTYVCYACILLECLGCEAGHVYVELRVLGAVFQWRACCVHGRGSAGGESVPCCPLCGALGSLGGCRAIGLLTVRQQAGCILDRWWLDCCVGHPVACMGSCTRVGYLVCRCGGQQGTRRSGAWHCRVCRHMQQRAAAAGDLVTRCCSAAASWSELKRGSHLPHPVQRAQLARRCKAS
jgi:hypothetical protein